MIIQDYRGKFLRFKYYGDFDMMKWVAADCIEDLKYIGNSSLDAAPIFLYKFDINFDTKLFRDFKELSTHLRSLKIRNYTKKDLTKKERSVLTFFNFFMNSDENKLIKGVGDGEINPIPDFDK